MAWITEEYLETWQRRNWIGSDAPRQVVQIRRGNFRRDYREWHPRLNVYIPGETRNYPWYPIFTETTDWYDVPNINSVELNQSFDQNGMTVASMTLDNVWYEPKVGPGGNYHAIVPGYFAPYRGEDPETRPASGQEANDWSRVLTKNADMRVWWGFGDPVLVDGAMPLDGGPNGTWVFHGLVDGVDTESSPVTANVTARMGKTLTDQRIFGWAKSKQLLDPVIFAPRKGKSEEDALAGKLILIDDISDMVRCVLRWAGITEWEIEDTGVNLKDRLTFNRTSYLIEVIAKAQEMTGYTFFLADPTNGESLGVGIFRRTSALLREGVEAYPTRRYNEDDDHAIPDDDPDGVDVVFTSGRDEIVTDVAVSFFVEHTYDSDLKVTLISPEGTEVVLLEGVGESGNDFGTGNSDENRTTLSDQGTAIISGEDAPFVGIFRPMHSFSAFDGENIEGDWILRFSDSEADDTGTVRSASLFLTTVPTYKAAAAVALEVTDEDMLTGLRVTEDEKPLAYIIRCRGKRLAEQDGGLTLGGEKIARVMAVYRPPWTDEEGTFFGEDVDGEMAGLIKHSVQFDAVFTTYEDCLMGCYLAAVAQALQAVTGTFETPGMPYLELDDQVGVMDDNTGTNQRVLISNRTSTFRDGEEVQWSSSFSGSMIDNHYLIEVLRDALGTDFGASQPLLSVSPIRPRRIR